MNLISQHCLAGNIYKHCLKTEYPNPFIWTVIDFINMKLLIDNWNKLNFLNYELIKDENWNFSIIIDNKIKVQFVHYKFNAKINGIQKIGPDIVSNKIWEYIITVYEKRVKRMIQLNEPPIFCICNFSTTYKDAIYSNKEIEELKQYNNVIVLKDQEKVDALSASINFYNFLIP